MNTLNAVLYNEILQALSCLESGLITFNIRFTESNMRELKRYIEKLDKIVLEFDLCYKGPVVIKLELLQKVQLLKGDALVAIHEFNQLSSI